MSNETIGDYSILGRLALGGMAEILLAKRVGPMGFSKPVVLKRLLPQLASDTMFTTMFLNEARLAARLTHPNIVQINDLGQSGASFFIAMEYLPGEDLATIVRVLSARKATVPVPLAVRIVADAAAALHYAHIATGDDNEPLNIVHRDVSPQNIVLTTAGVVKLVDFGIAKAEGREGKTQTGIVKGKVEYMPPEQLMAEKVDHRADIFALGVVLYEAICGKRPVDASVSVGDRLAGSVVNVPILERLPDVNPELARIVTKAIAPDPKNRHQSADELRSELEAFLEASGVGIGLAELSQLLVTVFGARHVASLDRRLHSFNTNGNAASPAPAPVVVAGGVPPPPPRDGGTLIRPQAPSPAPPSAPEKSIELDVRAFESTSTVRRKKAMQRGIGRVASIAAAAAIVLGGAAVFATRRDRDHATLQVTSTPNGAHVRLDDRDIGNTPINIGGLVVGHAVDVRISAEGHRDYREVVTPMPGVVAHTLHASLVTHAPKAEAVAVVAVVAPAPEPSAPVEPTVVDVVVAKSEEPAPPSEAAKPAPDSLSLALKRAQANGRQSESRRATSAITPVTIAPVVQAPAGGFITVTSGVPMRVFADGVDLGNTPVTRAAVSAGSHTLKVASASEGLSRVITVDVAPEATLVHRVSLERGSISVDGVPGSRVYVGSRELGVLPLNEVPLLAGDYTVMVERPGSAERQRYPVTVRAGLKQRLQAN